MNQKFTKEERLTSKVLIKDLFENGKKWHEYPFKVTTLRHALPFAGPVQLLISVPRAIHRKATDRNRIKRLIRESYRKNKSPLYESLGKNHVQLLVCLQYNVKEILAYQLIQEKIIVILQRLKDKNAETAG